MNDPKAALEDLNTALASSPKNGEAWMARGMAYEQLNDQERARAAYARAVQSMPANERARAAFTRVGGKPGVTYSLTN
jgi:Flp pilus assembly protein TadD